MPQKQIPNSNHQNFQNWQIVKDKKISGQSEHPKPGCTTRYPLGVRRGEFYYSPVLISSIISRTKYLVLVSSVLCLAIRDQHRMENPTPA